LREAGATGSFTVEELRDHHVTMVVENFDDPVRIVSGLRRYPHKGN
jgi:hypothetical protein